MTVMWFYRDNGFQTVLPEASGRLMGAVKPDDADEPDKGTEIHWIVWRKQLPVRDNSYSDLFYRQTPPPHSWTRYSTVLIHYDLW